MALKYKLTWGLGLFALSLAAVPQARATSLSQTYTGVFTSESGTAGSVLLESFTLTSPSQVTIYTTSYGGGMNLNGTTTGYGGFQPNITLFDNTGFVIANQTPSFSPIGKTDPNTGLNADGYLQDTAAPAGTYYVTLTDWQNQMPVTSTGLNLSQAAYLQFLGPGGSAFQDVQGNSRTGNYSLNLSTTSLVATPEPATFALVLPALAAGALIIRKRRSHAS